MTFNLTPLTADAIIKYIKNKRAETENKWCLCLIF